MLCREVWTLQNALKDESQHRKYLTLAVMNGQNMAIGSLLFHFAQHLISQI